MVCLAIPLKVARVPSRGDNTGNTPGLANIITVYQATGSYLGTGHRKTQHISVVLSGFKDVSKHHHYSDRAYLLFNKIQ